MSVELYHKYNPFVKPDAMTMIMSSPEFALGCNRHCGKQLAARRPLNFLRNQARINDQ